MKHKARKDSKFVKVVLLTNTISPYRIPVFNHIAEKVDIRFVFLCDMLEYLKLKVHWDDIEFDYYILKGKEIFFYHREFTLHLNAGFLRLLTKEDPDVIVSLGYTYVESVLSLIYAKLKNKRFVLWSGSTLDSSISKNFLVKLIKKKFISKCDTYVTYGSKATEYLLHYGADEKKIITTSNTADVNYWMKKCDELRSHERVLKLRKTFLSTNILFVGQLIFRKGKSS